MDDISELPTIPAIYTKVSQLIDSSNSQAHQIAKIIEHDPAIATKILKLVNSPFFGFNRDVSNLKDAIVLLGFNTVRNIILSISVIDTFVATHESYFDLPAFWKHSIAVGLVARYMAEELNTALPDDAFSAGILHDFGKLVLDRYFNQEVATIMAFIKKENCRLLEGEQQVLGTDHAGVGEYLAERWNLPAVLVEAIALHHTPAIHRNNPDVVSLIHIANIQVQKAQIGSSGNSIIADIDAAALNALNMNDVALQELSAGIEGALDQAEDVFSLLS